MSEIFQPVDDSRYATAAQGALADTALQALDSIRESAKITGTIASSFWSVNQGTYNNTYANGVSTRITQTARFAMTDIRVVIWGGLISAASGDIITGIVNTSIKAAIEYNGSYYPFYFQPAAAVTLEPGPLLVSDALSLDIPAGATYYIRAWANTPSTSQAYAVSVRLGSSSTWAVNSDVAYGTGAMASGGGGWAASPVCAVLCRPLTTAKPTSLLVVGDSVTMGNGDTYSGPGNGLWARGSTVATLTTATASLPASVYAGVSAHYRSALFWGMPSHAAIHLAINDIAASRTASQVEGDIITIAKQFVARGVTENYFVTVVPRTTSTDSWATTVNQTVVATESVRIAINAWIRAGSPIDPSTLTPVAIGTPGALVAGDVGHPVVGYVEVANSVETAEDSGIWQAGYTSDGIHPNATGCAAAAVVITAFTNSL